LLRNEACRLEPHTCKHDARKLHVKVVNSPVIACCS